MSNFDIAGLPAICGGTPLRPLADGERLPHPGTVGRREEEAVLEVVRSNVWSGGAWHERAADALRDITGAKHVALCTNGTHALQLANASLGVVAGTRVMVPALTWQATAGNVLTLGGVPVIVDVDEATLTMSLTEASRELERRIDAGEPLPLVLWLVGLYHRLPAVAAFRRLVDEIAERTGQRIHLGLDFAHGPGGRFAGRSLLGLVDVMTGSGQESKNAKGGEAGWIATNDLRLHQQIESRITCGRPVPGRDERWQSDQFRLPALVAAPYACQLERYRDDWLPKLQSNARRIDEALRFVTGVRPLGRQRGADSQVYKLAFRITPELGLPADVVWRALEAEIGYEVRGPYPSLTMGDDRNPYFPGTSHSAAISDEHRALITTLPPAPVAERALEEVACVEWAFLLRDDCAELLVAALNRLRRHAPEIRAAVANGQAAYWFAW